jgi:FMN-dependent NADH-azoreductase
VFAPFKEADEYLFTVPMWNAGVPWVLKHLIDTITQPGLVLGFDPAQGYIPLLQGKRAVVVYTSGVYSLGAPIQFGTDFHAEFFNDWLRFIGVEDVSKIRFQPTVLTAIRTRRGKPRSPRPANWPPSWLLPGAEAA